MMLMMAVHAAQIR